MMIEAPPPLAVQPLEGRWAVTSGRDVIAVCAERRAAEALAADANRILEASSSWQAAVRFGRPAEPRTFQED